MMGTPRQSFNWECEGETWRVERFPGIWFALRLFKNGAVGVCVGRSYKGAWEDAQRDLERDVQMWLAARKP